MTHPTDPELLNTVRQLLTEQGHQGFAEGICLLVGEAMRRERAAVLQAQPYERTDCRQGLASGFKPKTLTTRMGNITFRVPQVPSGTGVLSLSAGERRSQRASPQAGPGRDVCSGRDVHCH